MKECNIDPSMCVEIPQKIAPLPAITTEDYQMNITMVYAENPTSVIYAGNKVVFALYPICIEYHDEDGVFKKGALAFLSEDRQHDHQQVQEKAIFQVIRERIREDIIYWICFSDGCTARLKSGHTVADLMDAPMLLFALQQACFNFFASHEGKNLSDTIGSIAKAALKRGILKDTELEVRTVEHAIEVITENLREKTKAFEFVLVQPFPAFERNPHRKELAISRINQLHSMLVVSDNLYVREISCTSCTSSTICADCKLEVFATSDDVVCLDADTSTSEDADKDHHI